MPTNYNKSNCRNKSHYDNCECECSGYDEKVINIVSRDRSGENQKGSSTLGHGGTLFLDSDSIQIISTSGSSINKFDVKVITYISGDPNL